MSETISINFHQPIPVFPLSQCVLLPGAVLPLHVFELRYQQLAKDILDSNGLVGMALFKKEPSETEYQTNSPELRRSVGIGYCVDHERLEDGRYLIVLKGICRARIQAELEHEPYRKFILNPTDLQSTELPIMPGDRDELKKLLNDQHLSKLDGVDHLIRIADSELPTSVLVDITVSTLCDHHEERYAILDEANPAARVNWLLRRLKLLRQRLHAGGDGYARMN